MQTNVARSLRNLSNKVENRSFSAKIITTIENFLIRFWITSNRPNLLKDVDVAQMLDASRRNTSLENLDTYSARSSPVTTDLERETNRSNSPVTNIIESSRSVSPVAELMISCLKSNSTRRRNRVRFNSEVQVMLIPARSEYLKADLNKIIWWNLSDLKNSFIHMTSLNDIEDDVSSDMVSLD